MAIISSYPQDVDIRDKDAWVGTDFATSRTKQYTAEAVANYLNTNGKVSIAGQIAYKFVDNPFGGQGTMTLSPNNGTSFSVITGFKIAKNNLTGKPVVAYLEFLVGQEILIVNQSDPESFGHYTIDAYAVNSTNNQYYDLTLSFLGGNGSVKIDDFYDIVNFSNVTISGTSNEIEVTRISGSELRVGLPNNVNVAGTLQVFNKIIQTSTGNENSFSSKLNMNSNKINSLADPTSAQDAATKAYVDAGDASQVTGTGTTQTLPVWSDGPNGVLGDSAIKQHNGNNITIGIPKRVNDPGLGANYTLSVGNGNMFTNGTTKLLAVGVENWVTSADVSDSAVIGIDNLANSSYSLTVGQRNQTNGGTSFVAGVDNVTSSGVPRQFVIGRDNTVDSIDTIVLGDRNIVTETGDGFGSMMVFGHLNDVKGDRIVCLGTSNIVKSDNQGAYIIGAGNSSTADRTYSVGQQNGITGNESYAFGKSNTVEASASVAVGTNNTMDAHYLINPYIEKAYAFGFGNDNINSKSFAIGDNNDVLYKERTYLIGRENKAGTHNNIILGQFSDPTVLRGNNSNGRSTVAFAVGSNNETRRTAWEFRGKQTSTGDTSAGDSMQIMAWALLYSTSYTDDTAAAAGGVEVGQLYRTGSTVKIRMT